jgi:hypothetical protein
VIFDSDSFAFEPPAVVAFAQRILIKPDAAYPLPHPVTLSRETLAEIVAGIRQVSKADIFLLEGSQCEQSMHNIYQTLSYDFPRVSLLDVRDCTLVEVENPLPRPFALPTFWLPNIVLSCDYLITAASFKIVEGSGDFCISNLLGLLPMAKYHGVMSDIRELWHRLGIYNVVADLYFTLPFDAGIIDARKKLISPADLTKGEVEEYGKVFVGQPYEVDQEASQAAGVETRYLRLIERARQKLNYEQW